MNTEDSITQFTGYFHDQLGEISGIANPQYRKTLLVVCIDTLGRARHPSGSSHQRIVDFLEEFSGWSHLRTVSLPQLESALAVRRKQTGKLYSEVSRLSVWQEGLVYRPRHEPGESELLKFAAPDEIKLIKENTYSELLYTFRNQLVHEFREPGQGFRFNEKDEEPYYHSLETDGGKSWELVFPSGFIISLIRNALVGLECYLRNNKINPYHCYKFGSSWRT